MTYVVSHASFARGEGRGTRRRLRRRLRKIYTCCCTLRNYVMIELNVVKVAYIHHVLYSEGGTGKTARVARQLSQSLLVPATCCSCCCCCSCCSCCCLIAAISARSCLSSRRSACASFHTLEVPSAGPNANYNSHPAAHPCMCQRESARTGQRCSAHMGGSSVEERAYLNLDWT
jgi:hypothetical protein